jgi:ribbon-helix-helix CopG family protein
MKTLTLRIDAALDRWLTEEAKRLGRSKSEIVREAIVQQRNGKKPLSLHDKMKDVCGIIKGAPRDLSTNMKKYLKGFGE